MNKELAERFEQYAREADGWSSRRADDYRSAANLLRSQPTGEDVKWAIERVEEMVKGMCPEGCLPTPGQERNVSALAVLVRSALATPQAGEVERRYSQAELNEYGDLGKQEGYDCAVQEVDLRTGGDGEYRYCTNHDPDRHTPDAAAMIRRIEDRFARAQSAEVERDRLKGMLDSGAKHLETIAFAIPAPNFWTPQLVALAAAMHLTALSPQPIGEEKGDV
jgi:hypothetical protein